MQFYEHSAQVTVPTPILAKLIELGFRESSWNNNVWPSFDKNYEDANKGLSVYFIGELLPNEVEPSCPSVCITLGFCDTDENWLDVKVTVDTLTALPIIIDSLEKSWKLV